MSNFLEQLFNIDYIIDNPNIAYSVIKEEYAGYLNKKDTEKLCEEGFLLKITQVLNTENPEPNSDIISILNSLDKEELAKWICYENNKSNNIYVKKSFKELQNIYQLPSKVVDIGFLDKEFLTFISQKNDKDLLSNYLGNILKYNPNKITEDNALYFLHKITSESWEKLKEKHPDMIEIFGNLRFQKNNKITNILQETAKFNPELYRNIKNDYKNLSLYENDKFFLQEIREQSIFIEEFLKTEKEIKINGKMFHLEQSKFIFDYCINNKKIENFDSYEIRVSGNFIITYFDDIFSNIIKLPLNEEHEFNKYQDVALRMLTLNTDKINNQDYIESFLYSITQHTNNRIKLGTYTDNMTGVIKMLDKFSEYFSKNEQIKNVSLRESIGDRNHENSEIVSNKDFMQTLFNIPGLTINKMVSMNENPLTILFQSAQYYIQEKNVSKIVEVLPLIQNFAITQQHKYTFDSSEKDNNLVVTILDKTKNDDKGFISKHISSFSDPKTILAVTSIMNDFEFTNLMLQPLDFLNELDNKEDKKIAQQYIVERAKNMGLLDCMPEKYKENNFFALTKIYSKEELFQEGKLSMLLKNTKSQLNDFVNSNASNNFIFETIDEDLSIYGFDYENPKILHSFIINNSSVYLDLINHKINNISYRCPKTGDTSLHSFIKQGGNYQCIQDIISIYPELAGVVNKQNKFPIQSSISKLKICKEGSEPFKNSSSIIKQLISLDYGSNKEHIISLINSCEEVGQKMKKIIPNWKELLDEKIILSTIRNSIKSETIDEKQTTNNEWKL